MTLLLAIWSILGLNIVASFDIERSDVSPPDHGIYAPFYDALLFADIAEILNEFDNNNGNSFLDVLVNSESDSEENINELLSEYQHYLEKAQKQRKSYFDKNKAKNKVPPLRHDAFSKTKPAMKQKGDTYYKASPLYNPTSIKFPQTFFSSPVDFLIPLKPKMKYSSNAEISTDKTNSKIDHDFFRRISANYKNPDLINSLHKPNDDTLVPSSSCFCKSNEMPCECACKQCYMPLDIIPRSSNDYRSPFDIEAERRISPQTVPQIIEEPFKKPKNMDINNQYTPDNTINVRIKVEVQLPNTQDSVKGHCKNHSHARNINDDDLENRNPETVNMFNFPIPLENFGFSKVDRASKSGGTIHKIMVHKKKKPRQNSNKKHRKKVVTFHNVRVDAHQQPQPMVEEIYNNTTSDLNIKINDSSKNMQANLTQKIEVSLYQKNINTNITVITTETPTTLETVTQADENTRIRVNVTKNENVTEDIENIISGSGDVKPSSVAPVEKVTTTRRKREITIVNSTNTEMLSNDTKKHNEKVNVTEIHASAKKASKDEQKKFEKHLLADSELLYWPNSPASPSIIHTKNITSLILEREQKKTKLNLTKEAIRADHTKALEKAIFGDVDWEDVDTVVPVFMSFVGKYIRGALTFCSQTVCHSMKCAEKMCVHRVCQPDERFNHRGHCAGSNETDSVASMESIMNLPSKVAFEIVDILQDRMAGTIFGKVTLCISSKCISFASSKNTFLKSRCSMKDLHTSGHCSNIKSA